MDELKFLRERIQKRKVCFFKKIWGGCRRWLRHSNESLWPERRERSDMMRQRRKQQSLQQLKNSSPRSKNIPDSLIVKIGFKHLKIWGGGWRGWLLRANESLWPEVGASRVTWWVFSSATTRDRDKDKDKRRAQSFIFKDKDKDKDTSTNL